MNVYMAVEIVIKPKPIKSIPKQKYQIFMYKRANFYYGFHSEETKSFSDRKIFAIREYLFN